MGAAALGGPPSTASSHEEEYHPQPASTYAAANQGPLQQSSVPYAPGLQAKRQTETTGQFQKSDVGAAAFGGPSRPSLSPRTEQQNTVLDEEIAEVDQLIKKAFSNTKEAFPDGETAERIRELRHWKELLESQRDELADLPSPTVSTETTAEEAVSRYEAVRKALVQDTMSSYAAAAGGKKPSGPAPVASTYAASAGALKSEEEREREARLREVGQAYAALPFPSVGERVGLTLSGAGKQYVGSMAQAGASVVDTIGLDGLYHYFSGKSGPYIPNPMVRSVLSPFEKRLINDVEGFSDKASESGAQDIAKAREGLDPAGKMLVSAGVGVTQMGGDAILSLATGGSALWFMLTRAFGGGVQEAKAKGYGREQQALLGLTSAATEYFTERLFGGNPVYDTDAGLINRMVGKLVKNPTVMEFLSSAPIEKVTEGLEEIVSGLLNPMAEWAITGTRPEYELDQIIEDGIVGVITALIAGGGTQVVNKVTNLVSDATADKLLRNESMMDFLTRKGGLKLNKKMPQEQKRTAVRQAVENVVHKEKTASSGKTGEYRAVKPTNVELPTVPIIEISLDEIAQLNGGVLPQYGGYVRDTVIERAKVRLGLDKREAAYIPASNISRSGEEYILKVTKTTLKKMFSPSDGGAVPVETAAIVEHLEQIANNAVWYDGEGDRKGRKQIQGIDHLITTVYIDGVPTVIDMTVRITQQNNKSDPFNVLYYLEPEIVKVLK